MEAWRSVVRPLVASEILTGSKRGLRNVRRNWVGFRGTRAMELEPGVGVGVARRGERVMEGMYERATSRMRKRVVGTLDSGFERI